MIDTATIIALSSIAYIIAVGLHEGAGHGTSCAALGGHINELGAFYVSCNYTNMSAISIRLVALAGPVVSVITGIVSWVILNFLPESRHHAKYLAWLLGSIGLMAATGYLLFSGLTGGGDFGTSREGATYQLAPAWLWRIGLTVLGGLGYWLVALVSVRMLDTIIGGEGIERVKRSRKLVLTSYLTGGVVSFLISLLNTHGLASALASSFGGTSALMWMTRMMNRTKRSETLLLELNRHWGWIVTGIIITVLYASIFGSTIRF
jgi:hypothetical protein